ncbi:MAG: zinc finger domain-containing protein [Thermoplasmata archaeon]|nr:zinc finger domain-containing protein [Thermoplasmata archaeon]
MITGQCTSCGLRLAGKGFTTFKCPACGEGSIGRCEQCRDQAVSYKCDKCGFQGP